jgi:hypothetical protein
MEPTIIGLAISALVPKLLELLKSQRWAPFINHYSPWVNRTTAVAIAFVTAVGVTVDFDSTAGVLTVGGLLPDQILRIGLTWLLNFAVQEGIYRRFINTPSSTPRDARRGGFNVIPILLAVGLSAVACAGKSKAIAVQADSTIYTILEGVQRGADELTASGAITKETRQALSPYLLKALKLGRSFNEAVSASTPLQAIAPLLDALRELKIQLSKLIPASLGGALVADLDRAIGLVPTGGQ